MAGHENIEVVAITTPAQFEQAYAIRRRVFIEEQNVPEAIELDDDDARAFHALALIDGAPVGTGRMLPHGEHEIKIGRMAVLRELRGSGIGREILEFLMNAARARGFRVAVLHAQLTAEGFYLRSGYIPIGDVFEEAGIAHRKMERPL
ncbi:MAG TPA: GNAT family N-acetyltransferase [Candidatus Binataceae bacterium]|nr:GNAT family N-acetyltransferase [Candidatus Binataceae bacterium]